MKIITKGKKEMWVSNNRVLVGGNKKITGRNPNFDTDETKLLISLWGDPKLQKTLITTHKKHAVISKLAEKMREYGYHRSAEEINTRIKNLKCFYNRIKKDLECGISTEPTWKHYTAMDEIMTRPIFSVRPNEVPKPSLRYKLEEARREREERGDISDFDGSNIISGSLVDSDVDDDENMSQDENNICEEIDYADDSSATEEKPVKDSDAADIKEEILKKNNTSSNNSIDIEDSTFIKDEPIDVDDDSDAKDNKDDDEPSDTFPLSEYIKLTANANEMQAASKIITTIATSLSTPQSIYTAATTSNNTLKLSQPTTIFSMSNNNACTSNNTPGKISLVPTNFLLKPPSSIQHQTQNQIQTLQQLQGPRQVPLRPKVPQHRILFSHQAGTNQQNNAIVNTSNGPMKVLLVNTMQKNPHGNIQNVVTPTTSVLQNKPVEMQNKTMFSTPTSTLQGTVNGISKSSIGGMMSNANVEKINLIGSSGKSSTGYRALIGQLIRTQAENNEINRKRLQLERERLEFEKSTAERFFNFLPGLIPALMNQLQQVQPPAASQPPPVAQAAAQPPAALNESISTSTPNISTTDCIVTSIPVSLTAAVNPTTLIKVKKEEVE